MKNQTEPEKRPKKHANALSKETLSPPADAASLRRRAEERLKNRQRSQEAEKGTQSEVVDMRVLVQELQIHQIELEMQNEELRKSRVEVEALVGQYTDLYDFAPAGYFTLDRDGTIHQVNLTGAKLLLKERSRLIKSCFGNFVSPADRPVFNEFLQRIFTNRAALSDRAVCEVKLDNKQDRSSSPGLDSQPSGGANRRHVHIEAQATEDGQECRAVVVDITERKQAEEELERHRMYLVEMVKERTAELEIKNITIQELNTTLKVLMKQREDDKKDMEERFVMNVRSLVLPFVGQMKKGHLDAVQQPCLDIIETHLNNIATPSLKNIRKFNFTPKELKVVLLVRDGRTTKEIAEILSITAASVDMHRINIRKKLGLNSRKTNLQSHLETLM